MLTRMLTAADSDLLTVTIIVVRLILFLFLSPARFPRPHLSVLLLSSLVQPAVQRCISLSPYISRSAFVHISICPPLHVSICSSVHLSRSISPRRRIPHPCTTNAPAQHLQRLDPIRPFLLLKSRFCLHLGTLGEITVLDAGYDTKPC